MKSFAQRIAIAEAIGWKEGPSRSAGFVELGIIRQWYDLTGRLTPNLPLFTTDLNAMQLAEDWLFASYETLEGAERLSLYTKYLCKLKHPLFATAAQRAECFLRALNLWIETP